MALIGSAAAQTQQVIFRFSGGATSGQPDSGLIADKAGNLYGTTNLINGGVYELSPPSAPGGSWTETTLYLFQGGVDGFSPSGGRLTMDLNGNLYGSNSFGGISNSVCPQGCGTIYKLSPPSVPGGPWTETILFKFAGGRFGFNPGPVTLVSNGSLVVAATVGGDSANDGFVMTLQPPAVSGGVWTKHLLYTFQGGADGSQPNAPFVADQSHNLYSTTAQGGSGSCDGGCGTVFELSPPAPGASQWTKTILYAFQGAPSDGSLPEHGLIFDSSGNLYGTTFQGGSNDFGTAFQLVPGSPWTENVLHVFGTTSDGIYPNGLIMDPAGNLYGATAEGGSGLFSGGTVYELSPPSIPGGAWSESDLHNFPSATRDGNGPESTPLLRGGVLFGPTFFGGGNNQCSSGCGTIYRIVP
ncbi:MAG: choice-of-anchor tandem repeat GloVer-containing protein [Candidatus Sulfotelmatobacter sp.]